MKRALVRAHLAAALGLLGAATASAQTSPTTEAGRYSFNKTDEGYLRLDTRSGQVSLCSRRTIGWACQLVPDERIALEGEIARLQDENARLQQGLRKPQDVAKAEPKPESRSEPRVESVKPPAATNAPRVEQPPALAPPLAERGAPELKLPSDEDVDRVMTFVEKVWRRLVDMMVTVQREAKRS
jgi:hypothetical protein